MIVFQKVTKIFPDWTKALDDLSFQIKKGEFVFFIKKTNSPFFI